APLWFVFFFGHYPIWKALIERLRNRLGKPWLGWLLKLLGFAVCAALLLILFRAVFTAPLPERLLGTGYGPWLLAAGLTAAFVFYDIAFSGLIAWFRSTVLPRLR
ncbi:MAG: hypothetical protein II106_02675, partial [Oscillospiraceae bacterium]|nr:hypothetical protein [Oscillospiraceae bacterium]